MTSFSDSQSAVILQSSAIDPHIDLSSNDSWQAELQRSQFGRASAIGDALNAVTKRGNKEGEESDLAAKKQLSSSDGPKALVVLMSDGRNNSGSTIASQIELLTNSGASVIAIGYGSESNADDLAVVDVQYPKQMFFRDQLRGSIFVKERSAQTREYQVAVAHDGKTLWQQSLETQNSDRRRVDFSFSVEDIIEQLRQGRPADEKLAVVPLQFEVQLSELPVEADLGNNRQSFRVATSTHTSSILIVDGRARWETRYIKNLFERDPNWKTTSIRLGPGSLTQQQVTNESQAERFPVTRQELMNYDLIVLGEVESESLSDEQLGWIVEFVQYSGGGLVLIDGEFGSLHQDHFQPIRPMMSLNPRRDSESSLVRVRPALNSTQAAILQIADQPDKSQQVWNDLQPIKIQSMEAAPGCEVLLESSSDEKLPVLAIRQFGAGRVAHFATDETWRWRFKVADQIHGRFWNQIASATMRLPFAVENSLLAIDSGRLEYSETDSIEIRCRLRQTDGSAAAPSRVEAVISSADSQLIAVMAAHPHNPGVFTTTAGPLPVGDYSVQVRATDFSADAIDLATEFHVISAPSIEMTDVTCDAATLRELSQRTGGHYLHESEVERLESLIQPFQTGKISVSDIILWQSYWWFTPIVLLLITEWILRKRSGLI